MPPARRRFLAARAAETGRVPKSLAAAPVLDDDVAVYWQAFWALWPDRAPGRPIALAEIAAWCDLQGLDVRVRRLMPRFLRAMEAAADEPSAGVAAEGPQGRV